MCMTIEVCLVRFVIVILINWKKLTASFPFCVSVIFLIFYIFLIYFLVCWCVCDLVFWELTTSKDLCRAISRYIWCFLTVVTWLETISQFIFGGGGQSRVIISVIYFFFNTFCWVLLPCSEWIGFMPVVDPGSSAILCMSLSPPLSSPLSLSRASPQRCLSKYLHCSLHCCFSHSYWHFNQLFCTTLAQNPLQNITLHKE